MKSNYDKGLLGKTKKSPMFNKPKSNKNDSVERQPRPKGLTLLSQSLNQPTQPLTKELRRKIDKVIINNYLAYTLYVIDYDRYGIGKERLMSLDELAKSLNITREKLLKKLNNIAMKDESFSDRETQQGIARVLTNQAFFESLNIGLKAERWLDTLMDLGMARNMPLGIQKELNAAFTMVMGYKRLGLDHIKAMSPQHTTQIANINNNNVPNTTNGAQYLDATMAVNLLNDQGHNQLSESHFEVLYLTEDIASTPNVIATGSDAQMSIVKNKIFSGHETRRAEELGTYTEILPEGPTNPGGLKNEPPMGMVPDK